MNCFWCVAAENTVAANSLFCFFNLILFYFLTLKYCIAFAFFCRFQQHWSIDTSKSFPYNEIKCGTDQCDFSSYHRRLCRENTDIEVLKS